MAVPPDFRCATTVNCPPSSQVCDVTVPLPFSFLIAQRGRLVPGIDDAGQPALAVLRVAEHPTIGIHHLLPLAPQRRIRVLDELAILIADAQHFVAGAVGLGHDAAVLEGFSACGIEQDASYLEISLRRIEAVA